MWVFPKSGPYDSNRKSKLDEFFSGQNAATSVVREAIQNSLDAAQDKAGDPILVRFTLSERQWGDFEQFVSTEDHGLSLNDHTSSNDLGRYAEDFTDKSIRCLLVEDYGTRGLTGSTDKNKALSGSNFVGFWWNEGITGKGKGTLGNHGVGKTTLTRVSGMSTIWALTKRFDDDGDFLIGFSNLPFHQLDGCSYLGYGRYGVTAPDGNSFLPVEDDATISSFSETFGLDRTDYGLSVLIPAVSDNIDHDSILEAVLADYYWPILRRRLIVSIHDTVSGLTTDINAESLAAGIDALKDKTKANHVALLIDRAKHVIEMKDGHPNFFIGTQPVVEGDDEKAKRASLKASCFTDENLKLLKEQYEKGSMVGVQFSLSLMPVEGDPVTGVFEVFLQAAADGAPNRISQVIRSGIIISEQRDYITGRFGYCFVIVEDQEMSDYLGLAEGPAHTKWLIGKFNDHKKFKSDWSLRFVMDAARELYRILVGEDEEKDKVENFAADIFSISKPSEDAASEKKKKGKGKKSVKPDIIKPDPSVDLVRVEREQKKTGFTILPVKDLDDVMTDEDISFPFTVEIEAAYLSVGGNIRSFNDYSSIDFDFSKSIDVDVSPMGAASIIAREGNKLVIEVAQSHFQVTASGFDKHRDLLIRTDMKVGA